MASIATFPNPYLVAILLVCATRTGSGAQILFHYPSAPLSESEDDASNSNTTKLTDSEGSTDSEESATDEDEFFALPGSLNKSNHQSFSSNARATESQDDHISTTGGSQQNGSRKQHEELLFGLAEDGLVSLLSPDRTWHKRKFELGINDLTFVGRPVFVRPDGTWRRTKPRGQQNANDNHTASDTATDTETLATSDDLAKSRSSLSQGGSTQKSELAMFQVVFVMNPPPLEHTFRIKDMYDNVIKKLSRALKWEQGHNDYVWKEAEIISSIKTIEVARRSSRSKLCAEMLSKSSLASALASVYNAISSSRIASISLGSKIPFSFQIPPVTSTSYLPSLTDPPIQPGLWLTTANDIASTGSESENADPSHASHLAKHYTLLLKAPPHRIAKDAIDAGGRVAAHLPKFVSSLRPTNSFYKLSVSSHMSLSDIQALAHHLIYWRRAIAIPPLHQKDVYIVSPNADMSKLRDAAKSYELQFAPTMPNMPSLPKILSALSGVPRPFGNLIPSTDHKEIYYLALAWLLRNGWVTQLRTFAYIRVNPEVKRAIRERDRDNTARTLTRQTSHKDETGMVRDMPKPRKRPSIISRRSSEARRPIESSWPTHNPRMASLILHPPRASPTESKWLEAIEASLIAGSNAPHPLSSEEKSNLTKYWPLFVKYFNGHVALETIPVRETLKRSLFWSLLQKVGLDLEHGVEDSKGVNKAVLVAVRHW